MKVNTGQYGTATEVRVEELDVESGTHQDHLQHLQARQKFTQNNQKEVTESVSLMNLILAQLIKEKVRLKQMPGSVPTSR